MADITMPQLGETVTEGTITKWFKSVGDEVSEDEPLFEVSTDKVDSEVPSPASGYLAEILVEEGDTVDVGTKLAVVSADAPSGDGDSGGGGGEKAEKKEPEEEKVAEAAQVAEDQEDENTEEDDEAAEDVPEDEAPDEEARPSGAEAEAQKAEGPSKSGERSKSSTKTEAREESKPAPAPDGDGNGQGGGAAQVLSPVVRRLISEHDLDPDQIEGTGQGGRITRADVLSFIDKGSTTAPEKREAAPKEAPAKQPKEKEKAPARASAPSQPAARAAAGEDDE